MGGKRSGREMGMVTETEEGGREGGGQREREI